MPRVKVTAYIEADDSLLDLNHPSGLTEEGFLKMNRMLAGFEDIETEVEE